MAHPRGEGEWVRECRLCCLDVVYHVMSSLGHAIHHVMAHWVMSCWGHAASCLEPTHTLALRPWPTDHTDWRHSSVPLWPYTTLTTLTTITTVATLEILIACLATWYCKVKNRKLGIYHSKHLLLMIRPPFSYGFPQETGNILHQQCCINII